MLRFAKRIWVLLVILLVVVLAMFIVDRFRGFFGHTVLTKPGAGLINDPAPFNPKVVKYEIFGDGIGRDDQLPGPGRSAPKGRERHLAVVADPDDDGSRRQPEHRRAGRR